MRTSNFLALLDRPRRTGRHWKASCPAHADSVPSLSIREADDGRILLRCFAGCSSEEIVGAMGLSLRDLFPDGKPDRDKLRTARWQREAERRADKIESQRAAVFREAEATIEAARGIDIDTLSDAEHDKLMGRIGDAYSVLIEEKKEERRREVESVWTDQEMQAALDQLTAKQS